MKAKVVKVDVIELSAETDADVAILRNISGYSGGGLLKVSIASSGGVIGEPLTEMLTLQFRSED